jgi:hypothetical protein
VPPLSACLSLAFHPAEPQTLLLDCKSELSVLDVEASQASLLLRVPDRYNSHVHWHPHDPQAFFTLIQRAPTLIDLRCSKPVLSLPPPPRTAAQARHSHCDPTRPTHVLVSYDSFSPCIYDLRRPSCPLHTLESSGKAPYLCMYHPQTGDTIAGLAGGTCLIWANTSAARATGASDATRLLVGNQAASLHHVGAESPYGLPGGSLPHSFSPSTGLSGSALSSSASFSAAAASDYQLSRFTLPQPAAGLQWCPNTTQLVFSHARSPTLSLCSPNNPRYVLP